MCKYCTLKGSLMKDSLLSVDLKFSIQKLNYTVGNEKCVKMFSML